jgi:hypothetical protein
MYVRVAGSETGGAYSVTEHSFPLGSGPAFLHTHPAQGSVLIREGTFEIYSKGMRGKETERAGPGVVRPVESVRAHGLKNVGSTDGRAFIVFHPPDLPEKFFSEVDELFSQPGRSQTPVEVSALFARHNLVLLERPPCSYRTHRAVGSAEPYGGRVIHGARRTPRCMAYAMARIPATRTDPPMTRKTRRNSGAVVQTEFIEQAELFPTKATRLAAKRKKTPTIAPATPNANHRAAVGPNTAVAGPMGPIRPWPRWESGSVEGGRSIGTTPFGPDNAR